MTDGILYLAMGSEYTRLAKVTIAHSRKFTSLPIHILTNQSIDDAWLQSNNVTMTFIDMPDNDNRKIKTRPDLYTPFDRTLYIDCDSLINKPGIEIIFTFLDTHDVVMHRYLVFTAGKKMYRLYKEAMERTGATFPLKVYAGCLLAFTKNERTTRFFETWYKYWELNGSGRDMPSLACAAQQADLSIKEIGEKDKIFSVMGTDLTRMVIHHNLKKFGISGYKQNEPFDPNKKRSWERIL